MVARIYPALLLEARRLERNEELAMDLAHDTAAALLASRRQYQRPVALLRWAGRRMRQIRRARFIGLEEAGGGPLSLESFS